MVGVRPEKWDVWNNTTYAYPEPGDLKVESGELSFYGNNNTASKYAQRDIPNVSLDNPTDLIELSFDFRQASGIDCDKFYFYFKNSETGAYFRVYYFERSRDLYLGQYSVENGYQNIYTNTYIDLRDLTNCRFAIHFGTVNFYLNDVWKGSASLDSDIESVNSIYVILSEAHYHFDNIKITNSSAGTLLDLKFDDGPYAEYADYIYNVNDERIMTITSASTSSTSYFPYKSYIYDGNGQVMNEYKYNKSGTQYLNNGYIYGNGQKVARFEIIDEGEQYSYEYEYYHNNYLGSAQAITNASGSTIWSRDYYPFGSDKDASGTGNDYKFTGKVEARRRSRTRSVGKWDEESDLYYSWHRYYDPALGMFRQVDPMWYKYPSLSSYHYCHNNPFMYVDRDGMESDFNSFVMKENIQKAQENNNKVMVPEKEVIIIDGAARGAVLMGSFPSPVSIPLLTIGAIFKGTAMTMKFKMGGEKNAVDLTGDGLGIIIQTVTKFPALGELADKLFDTIGNAALNESNNIDEQPDTDDGTEIREEEQKE